MPTPPIELERLTEARSSFVETQRTAENAPTQSREAGFLWRATQRQLTGDVIAHPELSPHQKAGWALAIMDGDPESDLVAVAEANVNKLERLDAILQQPDVPVLLYKGRALSGGREYNILKGSGNGVGVDLYSNPVGLPNLKIDVADRARDWPTLSSVRVSPAAVLDAITDPELVADLDVPRMVYTTETDTPGASQEVRLLVGIDSITAFIDKLLSFTENDFVVTRCEEVVYNIWRMAKQLGFRLDERSEEIDKWMKRQQEKVVAKHAKRLVDSVRLRRTSSSSSEPMTVELDEKAQELGLTELEVVEAAIRFNQKDYHETTEVLSDLADKSKKSQTIPPNQSETK